MAKWRKTPPRPFGLKPPQAATRPGAAKAGIAAGTVPTTRDQVIPAHALRRHA